MVAHLAAIGRKAQLPNSSLKVQLARLRPSRAAPPSARATAALRPGGLRSLGTLLLDRTQPMATDNDKPTKELTSTDAKPAHERRVSPRVRHAIDLLLTGQCRLKKDAAAKANLTPERLSRAMKESHVLEYVQAQTPVVL